MGTDSPAISRQLVIEGSLQRAEDTLDEEIAKTPTTHQMAQSPNNSLMKPSWSSISPSSDLATTGAGASCLPGLSKPSRPRAAPYLSEISILLSDFSPSVSLAD